MKTKIKALMTIANHYGIQNQLLKLCEECGELIKASTAVSLAINDGKGGITKEEYMNLVEELADVSVVIMQIVYLMNGTDDYNKTIEHKINRQLQRMKGEEHNA